MTDTFGDMHPNAMSPADILLCELQAENMRLAAQVCDLEGEKRRLEAQVCDLEGEKRRLANEAWETKHIFGFALSES
jgi:uncharacterized protein YciU (UPF0263 family)